MDRKSLLILAISLALFLLWSWLAGYLYPPLPSQQTNTVAAPNNLIGSDASVTTKQSDTAREESFKSASQSEPPPIQRSKPSSRDEAEATRATDSGERVGSSYRALTIGKDISQEEVNRLVTAEQEFQKGLQKQEEGNHRAAIIHFDTAIRLNPTFPYYYPKRAVSRYFTGDNRGADEDLEKFKQRGL